MMLAEPQRDITPEQVAVQLKEAVNGNKQLLEPKKWTLYHMNH